MVQCADGSFYVGSTSYERVEMRVSEHNTGRYRGFTATRRPVKLVWSEGFDNLCDVHARERQIKGWSRKKKQALIIGNVGALTSLAKRRGGRSKSGVRITGSRIRSVAENYHSPMSERSLITKSILAQVSGDNHEIGVRHPEARAKRAPKEEL
jgi:putative endonuclease